jgi:2-haloacid dehalogenase
MKNESAKIHNQQCGNIDPVWAHLMARRDVLASIGRIGVMALAAGCTPLASSSARRGGAMMARRPFVIAFDVIETLFALDSLKDRLKAIGLPPESLRVFFAQMLRDALALGASGTYKPFSEIASASLEVTLANFAVAPEKEKIAHVLAGLAELAAHPDVRPAFERVRASNIRIITLTNGSAENTRKLLSCADVLGFVDKTISVDEVRHWKPHREVYLHAARMAGVDPSRLALVAAHAWDTHGAKQAGLVAGWVQRQDKQYSSVMTPPDVRGNTLVEVVDALLGLPSS